jgi:hypothetical protein
MMGMVFDCLAVDGKLSCVFDGAGLLLDRWSRERSNSLE